MLEGELQKSVFVQELLEKEKLRSDEGFLSRGRGGLYAGGSLGNSGIERGASLRDGINLPFILLHIGYLPAK